MEKFGTLIPKFDSINCVPFFPIQVLLSHKLGHVCLDDIPEIPFMIPHRSDILYTVEVENHLIIVSNQ